MSMSMRHKLGYGFSVLALSAMSVSVTAMHAPVETGQIRDKGKPIPPKAKTANPTTAPAAVDNDLCGKPYTPPCRSEAVQKQGGQPTVTPTAAEVETGQLLDKGPRPWDKPKSATNPADTTPTAAEIETGQLMEKPRPPIKPITTNLEAGKGGKTWLFAALGALAAIGGIFLATSGDDTPTSP